MTKITTLTDIRDFSNICNKYNIDPQDAIWTIVSRSEESELNNLLVNCVNYLISYRRNIGRHYNKCADESLAKKYNNITDCCIDLINKFNLNVPNFMVHYLVERKEK